MRSYFLLVLMARFGANAESAMAQREHVVKRRPYQRKIQWACSQLSFHLRRGSRRLTAWEDVPDLLALDLDFGHFLFTHRINAQDYPRVFPFPVNGLHLAPDPRGFPANRIVVRPFSKGP